MLGSAFCSVALYVKWTQIPFSKDLNFKDLAIAFERVLAASHAHLIDLLAAKRIDQCQNVEVTYQLDQVLSSLIVFARPTKFALKCAGRYLDGAGHDANGHSNSGGTAAPRTRLTFAFS